ncbi:PLD nuclease N-terminal domain-containing protein [uncultured Arsenicicoccus sp.]|uniref:PLD nuclease N-terminal domain-containing protein n=1 Tax=uncultured Arsenicicoccus sp. TaxID=491339 RepID=UPI0025977E19|nr:PLD nuclease N-terminal domain-containing protein [uncultured Arsenicicoccus sp.]
MDSRALAALAPLAFLALALVLWCLLDLARSRGARHLPRWAWAVLVLASFPLGPVAYLLLGRDRGGRA